VLRLEAATPLGDVALDVAVAVAAGEVLALAGPSGAGKTSALRVAAGLLRPERGRVTCGDEVWLDTARGVDRPPEARRCGYVFQEYALFPHLSAWQNVAYPLRGVRRGERRRRALALLDRFGLAARADAMPRTLSGGERQRVALARALARQPDALLLDEPLSALDARTRAEAARTLAALLREAEAPAVLVTHDFAEAAELADRVAILDRGQILQSSTPDELAARPVTAFVADFTGAVVLTGVARRGAAGLTVVALDGGGEVTTTDAGEGPVAVRVFPWEIALDARRQDLTPGSSARNRVEAEVVSVVEVGGRARVALAAGQPLVAEVTAPSARALGLVPGARVAASWKATATRLTRR